MYTRLSCRIGCSRLYGVCIVEGIANSPSIGYIGDEILWKLTPFMVFIREYSLIIRVASDQLSALP